MEMPDQVREVCRVMKANAEEARWVREDPVYVSFHWNTLGRDEWCIGDNYDNYERGCSFNMIFRDGKWFYRDKWTGEDKEMVGGFKEAMGNASIWYTG
jgi:hypothetical protein